MRKVILTALVFTAFTSAASAQQGTPVEVVGQIIAEQTKDLSSTSDRVCPKATSPQVCRNEFAGLIAKIGRVNLNNANMLVAISKKDGIEIARLEKDTLKVLGEWPGDVDAIYKKYPDK